MNELEFERHLQNQELRRIPDDWRRDILSKARTSVATTSPIRCTSVWWRELFWPCPQAWAGLAAIWMTIGALYIFSPGVSGTAGPSSPGLSSDLLAAANERRLLLAELLAPTAPTAPVKPSSPGRRSDRRRELIFV
jgi:hypothetical protein